MWGVRERKDSLNMDVIRFPHETPLFFPRSDPDMVEKNLGDITTIIRLTHTSTVSKKQYRFTLQELALL